MYTSSLSLSPSLPHVSPSPSPSPLLLPLHLPPPPPPQVKLPRSGHQQIVVTEVVDAAHFWAQFNDIATSSNLELLMDTIRDHLVQRRLTPLTSRYLPQQLKGVFCLAMFHEDKQYYRARIERLDESNCMARVSPTCNYTGVCHL